MQRVLPESPCLQEQEVSHVAQSVYSVFQLQLGKAEQPRMETTSQV